MTQTYPAIREPLPCGFDPANLSSGREPCQMGWYALVALQCNGLSVLDVGSGMGDGLQVLRQTASQVTGQDPDARLSAITGSISHDISAIADKSFDCVTCFDVIEHVVEDYIFFLNLLRIARGRVFITTPNYTRSKAQNHCHCREYTIPQFCNFFHPDELWSGAPDGRSHITKLLTKQADGSYLDCTRDKLVQVPVPMDYAFTHSTVDGNEWPHILGIFDV